MFYSGIAGMGLTLLIAAITVIILRKSKERLTQKLDEEYGKRQK
jgi:hypothetical protein